MKKDHNISDYNQMLTVKVRDVGTVLALMVKVGHLSLHS